jgi:hypothetical protein
MHRGPLTLSHEGFVLLLFSSSPSSKTPPSLFLSFQLRHYREVLLVISSGCYGFAGVMWNDQGGEVDSDDNALWQT